MKNPSQNHSISQHSSQPLYLKVQRSLEAEIQSLGVGTRIETEAKLAERFNVSLVTVRQALAGLEHKGIIERRRGSGTYVADIRPPSKHVAVLLDGDIATAGLSAFYPTFLQSVRRALYDLGLESRPYLGFHQLGVESTGISCRDLMADIQLERIEGVITSLVVPNDADIKLLQERGIPLLDHTFLDEDGTWVLKDNFAKAALSHLRNRQRKRIGILGWESSLDQRRPFTNILHKLGPEYGFDMNHHFVDMSARGWVKGMGWERFRDFWRDNPYKPDALIILDDGLFHDCQRAIRELKINVPEDLDIVLRSSDACPLDIQMPVLVWRYKVAALAGLHALKMKELITGDTAPLLTELPVELSFETADFNSTVPLSELIAATN